MNFRVAVWAAGAALARDVVPNWQLASKFAVDPDWIERRTGIRSRRWGGVSEELAIEASLLALEQAQVLPRDLQLVVVATSTAANQIPSVASRIADCIGSPAGGFDVNAACAGFVYALVSSLPSASHGPVLVVGSDAYSNVLDGRDRGTSILFGDAAGALVVGPGTGELLATDYRHVPGTGEYATIPTGGKLSMRGRDIYRSATTEVPKSIRRALERAHLSTDDVGAFILHQANGRIVDSIRESLGVISDKVPISLAMTGNTSAASIPLTLETQQLQRREGDIIVLSGFGAGLSVATLVLRWGARRSIDQLERLSARDLEDHHPTGQAVCDD